MSNAMIRPGCRTRYRRSGIPSGCVRYTMRSNETLGKTTSARRFGIAPLVGTGVSDATVATPVGIGVSDATVGTLVGTGVSDVTVVTRSAVALGVGVASGSDVHAIIAIAMMPRQVAHNRPEADIG